MDNNLKNNMENNTGNNIANSNLNNSAAPALATGKKAPVWLFILIGVIVIASVAAVVVIISVGMGGNSVQKKITAAEKYLSELDYEHAIASYRAAIEIDSTSLEAYLGLADVYIAMAEEMAGKAAKFEAKGEADKAQKAYEEAVEYYKEAVEVLDEAIDNVSDSDRKKAEKKKHKVEERIEEIEAGENNESGDEIEDENDGATSEYDEAMLETEREKLREALEYTIIENGSDTYVDGSVLFSLLDSIACGNGCGYTHSTDEVGRLLAGDPDTYMSSFYMMVADHGDSFPEYVPPHAFWQNDYVDFVRYASVADLEYDVFSITGRNVDLTAASGVEIVDYQGVRCFKTYPEAIGYMGEGYYLHDIYGIEYSGDQTWKVSASIYVENWGWSLEYNTKYCDVYFYLKPNSESYYGYNVVDFGRSAVNDVSYYSAYENTIWNMDNVTYYDVTYEVTGYSFAYIDGDDIPELIIDTYDSYYTEAIYLYTYKNGTVIPYDLREFNDGQSDPLGSGITNGIFITPGAFGIYNSASYVPYSGKIVVDMNDNDYAGALNYSSRYYYDNSSWYLVRDSKTFMRDENGNIAIMEFDSWAVDEGYITLDEYDYSYSAPGYDPNAGWQGFEWSSFNW